MNRLVEGGADYKPLLFRVLADAEGLKEDTVWGVLGLAAERGEWQRRSEVLQGLPALVGDLGVAVKLLGRFGKAATHGAGTGAGVAAGLPPMKPDDGDAAGEAMEAGVLGASTEGRSSIDIDAPFGAARSLLSAIVLSVSVRVPPFPVWPASALRDVGGMMSLDLSDGAGTAVSVLPLAP